MERNYLILILLFNFLSLKALGESCFYSLPFQVNTSHRTLQGFHGKFSHQKPLQFAVDFEMSKGTKVFAARSGKVIKVKNHSNQSGKDQSYIDKANILKIKHKDGSIGYYAHFQYRGIAVEEGQMIKEGEFLGQSGCTGYCDGPHLHFEVHRPAKNKYKRKTVPFIFWSKEGKVENIGRQMNYTAAKNHKPCP